MFTYYYAMLTKRLGDEDSSWHKLKIRANFVVRCAMISPNVAGLVRSMTCDIEGWFVDLEQTIAYGP
jgi:hypothetical protein